MSTFQLGWCRSYRQALEYVARQKLDERYHIGGAASGYAVGALETIAALYQVISIAEVLDDLEWLRRDAADWMKRIEKGD